MKIETVQAQAKEWIRQAKRIVALTGAGCSAESGIPTFRGQSGLWRNFRAEDLATPEAFARDPETVWEWYNWRRGQIAAAEPNPGHKALAAFEKQKYIAVITQNVDGLHQRAGSCNVLELHGSIWTVRCTICQKETKDLTLNLHPKCACGGLLRPGVVWFGEALDPRVWHNAEEEVGAANVVIVAGTSAVVYPAASLAPLAKSRGARIIEINPDETPLSSAVDCFLRGKSGEILPALLE